MDMLGSIRDRILQPTNVSQTPVLRDGQIVQGKILKIHPNNRAEIQIGQNKMVAEITTPLSVGRQYFFQVQTSDQLVQLKVIGEHLRQDASENMMHLLQQLGLKATKVNMQFIQLLMNEKVPFNKSELQQALQLLDKSANKMEAIQTLKEMLLARLPLTNNVFQALSSNQTNTISPLLNQLMTQLQQLPQLNETEQKLLSLLENLQKRPLTTEHKIAEQLINQRNPRNALFHALKIAGLINHSIEQKEWNGRLDEFIKSSSRPQQTLERTWNQLVDRNILQIPNEHGVERIPTSTNLQQIFQHLMNENQSIQTTANKLMSIFHPLQKAALTNGQFTMLRNMVTEQLLPLLPESTKAAVLPLLQQNNVQNQTQIFQVLQALASNETYHIAQNVMMSEADNMFLNQSVERQFLTHVQQYFQTIGLADEQILKTNILNTLEQGIQLDRQAETVKSLLIQMISNEHTASSERVQQMIHFINGMQLQSVQESNQFIHAAIQIPGEKLALNQDIFMQFEGKKTEDGKIDPDFCRILFVLHLKNLQETIIDMNVQKRIISITIYNDKSDLTNKIKNIKEMLEDNLSSLHYHLSTVKWKPLYEQKLEERKQMKTDSKKEQKERFDFLV